MTTEINAETQAIEIRRAIYRIGTTQGLTVTLATTPAATELNNWGWQNRAYWLGDTGEVCFGTSGTQTLRIQIREERRLHRSDSAEPQRYLSSSPGPVGWRHDDRAENPERFPL